MKVSNHLPSISSALLTVFVATFLGLSASATPGPVTQLIWATQPGNATNGLTFGTKPVLMTADQAGNPSTVGLVPTVNVTVTLSAGTGPLVGTTIYNIGTAGSNGVVTFGNLEVDSAGTGDQITATTGNYGAAVPGMAVWLDANNAATVLTNGSGSVTNWLDLSGNNNNFNTVLGTGTGIRYTNATTASGRRTVTFPGVGSLMNTTYTNYGTTISIFIVSKYAVSGVGGLNNVGPMSGTDGVNNDYTGAYNFDFNYQNNNPPTPVYERIQIAKWGNYDPGLAYHDLEGISTGSGNIIYINGGSPVANSYTTGNFGVNHLSIGGRLNGAAGQGYCHNDVAEVLVYNTALSDANRQAVETYLSNKWFTASFPLVLSNAVSAPFAVAGQPFVTTVESKADGSGVVVPLETLTAGASTNVFAIVRNNGAFLSNAVASWSLQSITGGVVSGDLVAAGDNKSATFTAHHAGSAVIQAVVVPGTAGTGTSGVQTVVAGVAGQTSVESKADGTGVVVPAQNLTGGDTVNLYAIARDVPGNFVNNVAASWSLVSKTGGVVDGNLVAAGDNKSATFTAYQLGSGVVQAVANSFTGQSGVLTVNTPGTAPFVTTPLTPAGFTNEAGSQVTFTAGFGGTQPIYYQWQFNNGTNNVNLNGATNTTLSLFQLQVTNSGTYTLVASNAFGVTNVTAAVTITPSTLPPLAVRNYFSSEYHPKDNGWYTAPWSQSDPAWRYQLSPQPNLTLTQPGGAVNYMTITVNPAMTYQTVTGIGTSLEDTTTYTMQLNRTDDQIKALLRQLLDPNSGIGMDLFRICIGTSDFSDGRSVSSNPQGWYSYQDVQSGPFSITNDVKVGIIRVIKLAQQVLQESGQTMRIFGSAWSPPGWMKDSGSMAGGGLLPSMHTQFATYLNNFVLAYQAMGIPIYAITVNNEHYVSTSYPSCTFDANAEGDMVEAIGTQFKANNLNTKIWILDHNWDLESDAAQTLSYLKNSTPNSEGYGYCDATAFHHYGGDPTAMTTLHNAYPDKGIQFTEGSVWGCAGVDEVIQMFRNYCQSYMNWVAMVTQVPSHIEGPYNTVGALSPVLFIQNTGGTTNYYMTPEYFLIGQLSKFVRPGAIRIDSTSGSASTLTDVAFQNPDGKIVVVVDNQNTTAQNFKILCQGNQITATIPATTVATYVFNSGVTSTNPPPPVITVETKADGTGVVVPAQSLVAGSSVTAYAIARDSSGNFLSNIAATWSVQNTTGGVANGDLVPSADGKSATFTAHMVGSAVIQASAGTAGQSGVQTTVAGVASQIMVETKADGTGVAIPSQNFVTGTSINAYAITRDVGGNFMTNAIATWSLQSITGGVVSGDLVPAVGGKSATFIGHLVGSAVIQAVANTFTGQSGTITVTPGTVTQLIWTTQPGNATNGAPFGTQPVLKTADQSGNPTTVGLATTLNVTVALSAGTGPLLGTTNYNIGTSGGNGTLSFTNLQVNAAGTSNQLTASWLISSSTPAGISNCQLWLDAKDPSTLTLSGNTVTTWADKSGNGNNATAGTAPVVATNAYLSGSGTVVRFNGTSSYLNVNLSTLISQPYTILALEVDGAKSGNNSYFIGNTGGSTDQALHMGYYTTTTFRLGQWADDLSYAGTYTSTTTPRLWSGKLDTSAGRFMYLNGAQVATLSSKTTVSGTLASGHIGSGFDTSTSCYQGDLAEIAVYNRALTDAERTSVENYLLNKWLPGHSSTAVSSAFTVQPSGGQTNISPNQISGVQLFAGTNIAITILSVAGDTYQLQYSSSLNPANWTNVVSAVVTNSPGSFLTFTNIGGGAHPQGFYRFSITTP